jgi:2-isopropylmalate synthase
MAPQEMQELVYDWNTSQGAWKPERKVELDDETLRDGLQSPSVTDPPIEAKIEMLHLMDRLGIDALDVGLPGAGKQQVDATRALCREIVEAKLAIRPNCAARTLRQDVEPIARVSQEVGLPIEAAVFIGSSPIRQLAESWTVDTILEHSVAAIRFAVSEGLPVMYVTEDTTRSHPDTVRRLYTAAVEAGARRVCVADTVGHATPEGTAAVVAFVREVVDATGEEVKVDWHGHKDRALSVVNCLAAIRAGADRVHAAAIGIGERSGNAPMEQVLVNLSLLGWIERDLTALADYCRVASEKLEVPIPRNYPVVGADAFETATGVHAAAVIKAFQKGETWLADRVYSSVPASDFGLRQKIRVGPMSGRSNVTFWLSQHGYEGTPAQVDAIFEAAKTSRRLLSDEELRKLAEGRA